MIYFIMYLFVYRNIGIIERFYGFYYNFFIFLVLFFNIFYLISGKIKLKKNLIKIIILLILILFIYVVSSFVNGVEISKENPVKNIIFNLILDFNFSIFLCIYLSKKKKDINIIFKSFISSTFIDLIFSILRFNFKIIDTIFRKIYPVNGFILNSLLEQKIRLIGLGGFFFAGGVSISISLILIIHMFLSKNISKKEKNFLFFLYIFHFLIGILVARTTIIGFFISIFYLCFNIKNKQKLLKLFFLNFITVIIIFISYSILDKELQTWISTFVFKYGESSVKALIKMYEKVSLNLKTILIGDALWVTNSGYYMKIDVGYLRIIFFNGILGLLFQIFFNWNLTRVENKELKKLSNTLFVLYLILNLKGFIAYLPICFLIYLLSHFNTRNNKFKLLEKRNGEHINNNNSNSI